MTCDLRTSQVSEVATTVLKGPSVGKNIPTVAEKTQGEVIKFASSAVGELSAGEFSLEMLSLDCGVASDASLVVGCC